MVELRIIEGGGKPWSPGYTTDPGAWRAKFDDAAWRALFEASGQRMQETCDRITASLDRIDAMLQSILDHLNGTRPLKDRAMFEERDAHIQALVQQLADQRREAARRETHRRIQRLETELERSLPGDVPLHLRGFGVMEDPP